MKTSTSSPTKTTATSKRNDKKGDQLLEDEKEKEKERRVNTSRLNNNVERHESETELSLSEIFSLSEQANNANLTNDNNSDMRLQKEKDKEQQQDGNGNDGNNNNNDNNDTTPAAGNSNPAQPKPVSAPGAFTSSWRRLDQFTKRSWHSNNYSLDDSHGSDASDDDSFGCASKNEDLELGTETLPTTSDDTATMSTRQDEEAPEHNVSEVHLVSEITAELVNEEEEHIKILRAKEEGKRLALAEAVVAEQVLPVADTASVGGTSLAGSRKSRMTDIETESLKSLFKNLYDDDDDDDFGSPIGLSGGKQADVDIEIQHKCNWKILICIIFAVIVVIVVILVSAVAGAAIGNS